LSFCQTRTTPRTMRATTNVLALIVVVLCASTVIMVDALCGYTVNGKVVDMSPLTAKNGSYEITAVWNDTKYTFELQVCKNVDTQFKGCTVPSPVNQINPATGECINVGDLATTAWDENPSQKGIYVTYYHGQNIDSVIHRSARIYFECNATEIGSPVFEHVTTCGQYHFSWSTKYACF